MQGLRDWTWRLIVEGIVEENSKVLLTEFSSIQDILVLQENLRVIWFTFLKISGVKNFDRIPNTKDPESTDVKTALFMYSMQSFLYTRLNQISRSNDSEAILTLGPFSVLLTRIIEKAQGNRQEDHQMKGPFTVYRGIAVPDQLIKSWS